MWRELGTRWASARHSVRRLGIRGCVVTMLLVAPLGAGAQNSGYQLVGFSTAEARGDSGVLAINQICNVEFPGSRLCRSDEIVATVDPPLTPSTEYAWVHSSLVAALSADHDLYDVSGKRISLDSSEIPNCSGWSINSAAVVSMVISTDTGAVTFAPCSTITRVACCAPVP